ncbi:MAG: hypothetical protein Q7O12_04560 [Deltaproteobacteria bacterium]|nr:hypothetical protein [Deltaproteobacteria bacterium]
MIDTDTAQEMGREAQRQGMICAPSLDISLVQHLTPIFSENVAILKAWIAGWTAENLKENSQ